MVGDPSGRILAREEFAEERPSIRRQSKRSELGKEESASSSIQRGEVKTASPIDTEREDAAIDRRQQSEVSAIPIHVLKVRVRGNEETAGRHELTERLGIATKQDENGEMNEQRGERSECTLPTHQPRDPFPLSPRCQQASSSTRVTS